MDTAEIERVLEVFRDEFTEIERLSADVQCSLASAMPAVEAASDALKKLDRQAIAEIRAYAIPPEPVMRTVMAVMTVMKKTPLSWAQAKMELADGFLRQVINFDKDRISAETLVEMERFTRDPSFVPRAVSEASIAAGVLCQWIHAMKIYAEVYREVASEVEPKKSRLRLALDEFERKTGVRYELIVESQAKVEAEASKVEAEVSAALALQRERSMWNAWMNILALDITVFPESCEYAYLTEIVSLQESLPFVACDVLDEAAETHLLRFFELVSLVGDFLLVSCLGGDTCEFQSEMKLAGDDASSSVIVTSASGEIVFGPEPLPDPVTVAELSRRVAASRSCQAVQCQLLHECRQLRADELVGGGAAKGPLQLSLVIVSHRTLSFDFDLVRQAVAMRSVDPAAVRFLRGVDVFITKLASSIEPKLKSNFGEGLMEGLSEIAVNISAFFKLWGANEHKKRAHA